MSSADLPKLNLENIQIEVQSIVNVLEVLAQKKTSFFGARFKDNKDFFDSLNNLIELEAKIKNISSFADKIFDYENKFTEVDKRYKELKKELEDEDEKLKKLKKELEDEDEKLKKLIKDVDELEVKRKKKKSNIEYITNECNKVAEEKKRQDDLLQKEVEELQKKAEQLEEKKQEYNNLLNEIVSKEGKLTSLKTLISGKEKELENIENDYKVRKKVIDDYESNKEKLEFSIENLKNYNEDNIKKRSLLEVEIKKLGFDFKEKDLKYKELNKSIADKEKELEILNSQKSEENFLCGKLRQEKDDLEKWIKENHILKNKIDNDIKEYSSVLEKKKDERELIDVEYKEFKVCLQDLKKQQEEKEKQKLELEKELKILEELKLELIQDNGGLRNLSDIELFKRIIKIDLGFGTLTKNGIYALEYLMKESLSDAEDLYWEIKYRTSNKHFKFIFEDKLSSEPEAKIAKRAHLFYKLNKARSLMSKVPASEDNNLIETSANLLKEVIKLENRKIFNNNHEAIN